MAEGFIDELVDSAKVIVVAGLGGVGKTTLSASLAARAAAKLERKALVVTVDPARRLSDVLGSQTLSTEPILVPVGGAGRLWAQTVDMSQGWDRLITECAPDGETSELLKDNRLYQSLTKNFIRSHDYIALDYLADVAAEKKYDLVVVDTPPSNHVLDILDAPEEIMKLFESRLLVWLTTSNSSFFSSQMARPFLAIAEKALGDSFFSDVTEFFSLFSQLRPKFVDRVEAIQNRLAAPGTRFVTVTTAERAASTSTLVSELASRGYHPALNIRNKTWPNLAMVRWDDIEHVVTPGLRDALTGLRQQTIGDQFGADQTPMVDVAFRAAGIETVSDLSALFD